MSVLDENLRALSARDPEAAERLRAPAAGGSGGLSLQAAASGALTALLDGVHLHGRHDPQRDAEAQVRREIEETCTAVIAIGFGLGYGPERVRQAFPAVPLLVVEPDAALFREALAARDLRGFLSDASVLLHVGETPDALPRRLDSLPMARPGFLRLRPLVRARPSAYRAAEETIRSWQLRSDINVNTLNRFGRLWVRNLCRNMEEFLRCPGIGRLEGFFDGIPALVVAGGPSLDSVADSLGELRRRMLVISVNTSLSACLERGVEPDFTVVVDPQFWASRSLDWTRAQRGVHIAEPSTCPRAFRRAGERFFLCSSLFPLGETLEEAIGQKGRLGAGGSVSTSAWDLARLLGARPLYAAGLDLGFPGLRSHCRGAYPESMWRATADRMSTMETSAFASVRDIGLFPARSADGGTTFTDRRMLLYKWWFENQLRMHPQACGTLAAGSVAIEGMPLVTSGELLRLPVIRGEIDRRMEAVRAVHAAHAPPESAQRGLLAALQELSRQLAELERLSGEGLRGCRELGRLMSGGVDPRGGLETLDRIDSAILAVSARSIAGFLIQSIIHGVVAEGERPGGRQEVVARSEAVYAGISESAEWQRELIDRAIRELEAPQGAPRISEHTPAKGSLRSADLF